MGRIRGLRTWAAVYRMSVYHSTKHARHATEPYYRYVRARRRAVRGGARDDDDRAGADSRGR